MATGKRKSKLYQLPSLCPQKGLTIVISPFLALIVDQVADLNNNNVPAAMLCSSCDDRQNTKQEIMQNKFKLLYLTPEALTNNIDFIKHVHKNIGKFLFYLSCQYKGGNELL